MRVISFKNIFGPDGKMGRIQFIVTMEFILTPLWFFYGTLSMWAPFLNTGSPYFYGILAFGLLATYLFFNSLLRRLRDARLPVWLAAFAISPMAIIFILFLAVFPHSGDKSTF